VLPILRRMVPIRACMRSVRQKASLVLGKSWACSLWRAPFRRCQSDRQFQLSFYTAAAAEGLCSAFSGKALAILQPSPTPGTITLEATSGTLKGSSIAIATVAP